MKSQQPKRKRNPLSDCTNTTSSSAKSTKFKPSYFSHVFKNLSTNYASNPTSSPSPSTPPLPNKLPTPEIVDLEASGNISIAYGRRYSSNKRNDREKEVDIPTSSVPNSEPIKFHQQCQKDPNSFQNLTMEYERKRKLTRRTPFSDCTNTSSSVPPKSTKSKPSSSSPVFKNLSTNAIAVNLDDAANPSSSPSTFLSTPLPKKSSTPEIVDLEAPETISVVYSRRYSSNKRKDKEKEVVIPTSSSVPIKMKDKENEVVNLANSAPIKRKDKGKDTVISESSNFMDTWEKAIISESSASIKRKDKGKECDIPSSTTSISKVSNTRVKFDGLERAIPSKAKAFSAPCTKKHCAKSSKNGGLIKDYPDLQDYIKEQNAHFKEIDEFELLVEEVD
ncbi:hypothetical protein QL285_029336 [Trifolium repens]|nr:hypothetical protein QL285_029336 [Trifolium repens]